jgi:hypothetical protein
VVFLTDRLDEDHGIALTAARPEAELDRHPRSVWYTQLWADPDQMAVIADPKSSAYPIVASLAGWGVDDLAEGRTEHIARHDPARVLAEVAARRRRLERHRPEVTEYYDRHGQIATFTACEICGNGGNTDDAWPCVELLDDAAPFAGHEDYNESWRT